MRVERRMHALRVLVLVSVWGLAMVVFQGLFLSGRAALAAVYLLLQLVLLGVCRGAGMDGSGDERQRKMGG